MEAMMVEEEEELASSSSTSSSERRSETRYEEDANTIVGYPNRIVSSTHTGQSILTIASMVSTVLRRVCCRKRVSNLKFEDERINSLVSVLLVARPSTVRGKGVRPLCVRFAPFSKAGPFCPKS
jgi:hypothetical protein